MTPKEKAEELYKKIDDADLVGSTDWVGCAFLDTKKCALIAVDEILLTLNEDIKDLNVVGNVLLDLIKYWQEVKQEILKK
jgi:hypothetical protein